MRAEHGMREDRANMAARLQELALVSAQPYNMI